MRITFKFVSDTNGSVSSITVDFEAKKYSFGGVREGMVMLVRKSDLDALSYRLFNSDDYTHSNNF